MFSFNANDFNLAEAVISALQKASCTVASAESCTGGLISAVLTSVPGSSAVVMGGATTYSNESKSNILSVDPSLIKTHGAVSSEVASAMAEGTRQKFGTDIGVSATGIAGPDGGTLTKPVGLVWIGIATAQGTESHELRLHGDRESIRSQTVRIMLNKLAELMKAKK